MLRSLLRVLRLLPQRLELEHLRWARAELQQWSPLHPDLPHVIRRIRQLEDRCAA